MVVHGKKKKFACHICGKEYNTKQYVKQHVKSIHKTDSKGSIGKTGETINRIQEATQTCIQFVPDDPKLTDRGCYIIRPKEGFLSKKFNLF